ncbi:hypothetical protein GDO86_009582 [Hymenochirus boettgeri]|nr:hypothetical protein GDO86_009582 [Hymenochirus boettgeri]
MVGMSRSLGLSLQWKLLVYVAVITGWQCAADEPLTQETVRINVTVLKETEKVIEQVKFDIGYIRGQIHINGFLVSRGVTRITCRMDTLSYGTSDGWENQAHQSLVTLRLLVQDWPMNYSDVSRVIVQEEVIIIDGNQVQQNETKEVEFLISEEMEVLKLSHSTVDLQNTLLFFIPRDHDVVFTFPNIPGADNNAPQQTTREYNLRQNTTLEEESYPGKLPETPIRVEIPASSYKVICQIADKLREKLCLFWLRCYPVLIDFIQVVLIGVIGAAIVLEILMIVYPQCEPK